MQRQSTVERLHAANKKNNQNTGIEQEGEEEMKCLFTVEGKGAVYYFDGQK